MAGRERGRLQQVGTNEGGKRALEELARAGRGERSASFRLHARGGDSRDELELLRHRQVLQVSESDAAAEQVILLDACRQLV